MKLSNAAERNGRHVLTADAVREMRRLYETSDSLTATALAKQFGISRTQAVRILRYQQWQTVK